MSQRQTLRTLVVEKLVEAAEEIVSLFERTLVEYHGEILQSQLLQRAQVVLYREDVQNVVVGTNTDTEQFKVEKEEDSSLAIPLVFLKTEENVQQSTENPGNENTLDSIKEQSDGEIPDLDLHLDNNHEPHSCSNANNRRDEGVVSTTQSEPKPKESQSKNSATKSVISKARLQKLKFTPKSLTCADCGTKFAQRKSLQRHIRSTHNKERPHTCAICQKGFFRKYDYVNHTRIHTGERSFTCSVCGKGYMSRQSLRDHKCSNHSAIKLSDIQTVIVGANGDPEQIKVEQDEDPALTIPRPTVKTEENVQESKENPGNQSRPDSVEDQRDGERPHCSVEHQPLNCSDSNNPRDEAKASTDSHRPKPKASHSKNSAAKSVISKARLQRLRIMPKPQYTCPNCGNRFAQRHSMLRHIRSMHNEERRHTCTFCQKGFFRKYDYVNHMRIHTGERPFTCSVCDKGYMTQHSLRDHQRSQNHNPIKLSDIHTTVASVNSESERTEVKQSTENPGNEIRLYSIGDEENGDSPSCSVDQPLSCPDTYNTKDKGKAPVKRTKPKLKAGQSKNSAVKSVHGEHRPCNPKQNHSCSDCGRKYSHRNGLMRHIRNTHWKETNYTCAFCEMSFFWKDSYDSHFRMHTGERPFTCSICGKGFRTKTCLTKHRRLHKRFLWNGSWKMSADYQAVAVTAESDPNKALHSKLLQQPHVVLYREDIQTVTVGSDSEPDPMKMDQKETSALNISPLSVKTEESVEQSATNPPEETTLDSIGDQNEGDLYLDNNMSSDTDNSSDWETMDTMGTSRCNGLVVRKTISDRLHRCNQCWKRFKSAKLLNAHQKSHARLFTCTICDEAFRDKESYTKHTRSHSFHCPICQRLFTKLSGLKEHMSVHTGERPHCCSVCGMTFRLRKNLQRHMFVHKVQKPFTCSICQKGFAVKAGYESHMRIHTGERPFRCSFCDKGFREKKSLKYHLKSHKEKGEIGNEEME